MVKSWISSTFHALVSSFCKTDSPPSRLRDISIRTVNHFCPVYLRRLERNYRWLWVIWRLYFGILPKQDLNNTKQCDFYCKDWTAESKIFPSFFPHSHVNSKLGSFSVTRQLSWAFLSQHLGQKGREEGEGWLKWPPIQKYLSPWRGKGRERERNA